MTMKLFFSRTAQHCRKVSTTRTPPRAWRRQLHNYRSNPHHSIRGSVQPHTSKPINPTPLMQPTLGIWATPLHPLNVLAPLVICQRHKMVCLAVVTLDVPIVWQRRNRSRRAIMGAHDKNQATGNTSNESGVQAHEPKLLHTTANVLHKAPRAHSAPT